MRALFITAFATALASSSTAALAGVFVSLSASTGSGNLGLQSADSTGGSATLGFEFSDYVRLGYTHKRQKQVRDGYMADGSRFSKGADTCDYQTDTSGCVSFKERTDMIADSLDLTLVLYNGETIAPYILGGIILRTTWYSLDSDYDPDDKASSSTTPGPNMGGGFHVRLNRQFSLKVQYTVSPGAIYTPDRTERKTWDKDATLGLTYQL